MWPDGDRFGCAPSWPIWAVHNRLPTLTRGDERPLASPAPMPSEVLMTRTIAAGPAGPAADLALCCLLRSVAELHACDVVLRNGRGTVRVSQRGGAGVAGVDRARLPAAVERGTIGRGGRARRYRVVRSARVGGCARLAGCRADCRPRRCWRGYQQACRAGKYEDNLSHLFLPSWFERFVPCGGWDPQKPLPPSCARNTATAGSWKPDTEVTKAAVAAPRAGTPPQDARPARRLPCFTRAVGLDAPAPGQVPSRGCHLAPVPAGRRSARSGSTS